MPVSRTAASRLVWLYPAPWGREPYVRIKLWIGKQRGGVADEFFAAFKALMKTAKTWRVVSVKLNDATIESTATISSLPCQPRWRFTEQAGGGAAVACLNEELSPAQQAHALGDLIYLCLTSLSSHVAKIEIVP